VLEHPGAVLRLCQPGKHCISQDAERAPSLGLEAIKGKGTASSRVHGVWMISACPSFSTGGISTFYDIWFSTQHNDNLETSIQLTLLKLYCQLSKHLFQAELAGNFLNFSEKAIFLKFFR